MNYRIEDNFLPFDFYNQIKEEIYKGRMPFIFSDSVSNDDNVGQNVWYLVHNIYNNKKVLSQYYETVIIPILDMLGAKAVINAKVNLYPSTSEIVQHGLHSDVTYDVKSAVIYFTTCDGYTYLKDDNVNVESIENRCLHFNSKHPHNSTTTTNKPIRVTMNINYF